MDEYQHLREDADMNAATSIRTIAQMLIEHRDAAHVAAVRAREYAATHGYAYSLTAEQAEGSHAAYTIACAIVAGACGVASIDALVAADPEPVPDLYAPELQVTDIDTFWQTVGERPL